MCLSTRKSKKWFVVQTQHIVHTAYYRDTTSSTQSAILDTPCPCVVLHSCRSSRSSSVMTLQWNGIPEAASLWIRMSTQNIAYTDHYMRWHRATDPQPWIKMAAVQRWARGGWTRISDIADWLDCCVSIRTWRRPERETRPVTGIKRIRDRYLCTTVVRTAVRRRRFLLTRRTQTTTRSCRQWGGYEQVFFYCVYQCICVFKRLFVLVTKRFNSWSHDFSFCYMYRRSFHFRKTKLSLSARLTGGRSMKSFTVRHLFTCRTNFKYDNIIH